MKSLLYEIVDVFTDRPFAGNPLAVVFGADDLSADQMLALAREFHLSETIFVLPASVPEATYRVRIFTPGEELPFAGHPSVGAAVTLMRRGLITPGQVIQECGAGLLPVQVTADGTATLRGGTPTIGPELDPAPLIRAVGLAEGDFAGLAPRRAGCGLEFTYLPVRPDALARATEMTVRDLGDVSVFAWDAQTRTARARVFCPGVGVPEDPATGSAALGLGVWLVAGGLLPGDAESAYTVIQGVEMLRPSTLTCRVTATGGRAESATVSGGVMPIARGEIAVPPA